MRCLSLPHAIAARVYHTCVALSDGAILVMGGIISDGSLKKDVWKTEDGGASWILMTSSAGWTGKAVLNHSLPTSTQAPCLPPVCWFNGIGVSDFAVPHLRDAVGE